jgi:hypothetical protein
MRVRIFKPAKTAMQSGRGKTRNWVLEFEPTDASRPDPLMGWNGSADTERQVRLRFASAEEAVAYAERRGYEYSVAQPRERRIRPKAYADNFAFGRAQPWTH